MWQYRETFSPDLRHYGVLGMKWGVRNEREYEKGRHGKFLDQSRDQDIRIKKGTIANRVQSSSDVSGKGQSYISFDKLDHLEYVAAAASREGGIAIDATMGNGNDGRAYSVKLKISNDIVAPSYQKTMDTFIETIGQIGLKKAAKSMGDKSEARQFIKDMKHVKVEEARDRAYVNFASKFMGDSFAKRMFFDSLKKQGYNAIVDDWDAKLGSGGTKTPMIVFDKSASVKKVSATPLSAKDYEYFSDLYWGGGRATSSDYFKETRDKWDKTAGSTAYRDS